MRRSKRGDDRPEIPIAPMIDCVFLMLVYFMTTSSLEKSEADLELPYALPGASGGDPLPAVDEQVLVVDAGQRLQWNGSLFPLEGSRIPHAALDRLERFRVTCEAAGTEASLIIRPHAEATCQSLVTLLDGVSAARIDRVVIR